MDPAYALDSPRVARIVVEWPGFVGKLAVAGDNMGRMDVLEGVVVVVECMGFGLVDMVVMAANVVVAAVVVVADKLNLSNKA